MSKFKNVDYVFVILCLMGIRSIVDANLSQALIVACFAGVLCFRRYLDYVKKPDINEDIKRQIEDLRSNMSGIMMKNAAKPMMDNRKISF